MAVLTTSQVRQYLQNAGFTGNGLSSGVIIVQRESGNDTLAVNKSDPYGGSYGMWQINGSHIIELFGHSITLAQAYDPQASSNYAYELSQHGSDFHDWATAANLPVSNYSSTSGGSNTNTTFNPDVVTPKGSGYTFILAYVFVIIIFTLVGKSRIGYVAIYYMLVLVIILLFVTQAQFVADAIVNFNPFGSGQ